MIAVNNTNKRVLAQDCQAAYSFWRRLKGLLGRRCLPENCGLHLKPCNSIHTFWMRFSIDAIFLDKNQRIVALYRNLKPWRLTRIVWSAHSVLEIPAGSIEEKGCRLADGLEFR